MRTVCVFSPHIRRTELRLHLPRVMEHVHHNASTFLLSTPLLLRRREQNRYCFSIKPHFAIIMPKENFYVLVRQYTAIDSAKDWEDVKERFSQKTIFSPSYFPRTLFVPPWKGQLSRNHPISLLS